MRFITVVVKHDHFLQEFLWCAIDNGMDGAKERGPTLVMEDDDDAL